MKQSRQREAKDGSEVTRLIGQSPDPPKVLVPEVQHSSHAAPAVSCPRVLLTFPPCGKLWTSSSHILKFHDKKLNVIQKPSSGFKHPCQSWLSSPGDFYPNNRSLWCAWPEGPWAVIMSKIWIYWVMQINKKETGSLRLFHYCLFFFFFFFAVRLMDGSKQNISLFTTLIICAMGVRELGFSRSWYFNHFSAYRLQHMRD